MSDQKIKHLELIQAIIARMAGNSFLIKGWSITLVSALFALAAKDSNHWYVLISYFPALMFWFLDGFFLSQERLFRKLYDGVRMNSIETDFSMNTAGVGDATTAWGEVIFSKTILLFHLVVFLTICIVMFFFCGK